MSATDIQMDMADDTHAAPETNETLLAIKIFLTVVVALAMWGVAIFTWGVPGLYLPALALVPVLYLLLIVISRG